MHIKEIIYTFVAKHQPARRIQWPHWQQVQHVLVLYDSDLEEQNMFIQTIKDELRRHHIDAYFVGYVPKKEIQSAVLSRDQILGKQSFTFFGYPRKGLLSELLGRHYDLVLNLSQSNTLPVRYMCLLADASFKAGMQFDGGAPSPCNLQIQTSHKGDPIFLFRQILHYLTEIQSND